MDTAREKDFTNVFGELFNCIISDMKRIMPIWEELVGKSNKLSVSLRSTAASLSSFLDTLQKIADVATGARGATKEIGFGLTKLCLRHRSIENKLKTFNSGLLDAMVIPVQEKLEEWKRSLTVMDKEHSKGKPDAESQLRNVTEEVKTKKLFLEEFEKSSVRAALVEERTRFCLFISCLKPVTDIEVSMLTELTHIQDVIDSLCMQVGDPNSLPAAGEQIFLDVLGNKSNWFCQTPPTLSSPLSRSSLCSINGSNCSSQSSESFSPQHSTRHSNNALQMPVILSQDHEFVSSDLACIINPSDSKSMIWSNDPKRGSWNGLAESQDINNARTILNTYKIQVPSTKIPLNREVVSNANIPMKSSIPVQVHSLPPTPNPYATPSLVSMMTSSKQKQYNMIGSSCARSTSSSRIEKENNFDHLQMIDVLLSKLPGKGVYKNYFKRENVAHRDQIAQHGSLTTSFDCESPSPPNNNSVISELNRSVAAPLHDFPSIETQDDFQNYDEETSDDLAAAIKQLEWTAAMLDSVAVTDNRSVDNNSSLGSTTDCVGQTREKSVSSLSKPPAAAAGITRHGSMQSSRKPPPPPIRRTSSVAGSSKQVCATTQGTNKHVYDNRSVRSLDRQASVDNNQCQRNSKAFPLKTVAIAAGAMATEAVFGPAFGIVSLHGLPAVTSVTEDFLPPTHCRQKKIPSINRTASQPSTKTLLMVEDEVFSRGGGGGGGGGGSIQKSEKSRLPRRSLSDTHAKLIQTLNQQFLMKQTTTTTPPTTAAMVKPTFYMDTATGTNRASNDNRAVTSESRTSDMSLSQIQEGVIFSRSAMMAGRGGAAGQRLLLDTKKSA